MRVVVLGANGMLGRELLWRLPLERDIELMAFPKEIFDIRNFRAWNHTLPDCDVIINAAAYTDVDGCELDLPRACEINGWALREMGRTAAVRGIRVIHYSTDFVFPGDVPAHHYRPNDDTKPVNAYGFSKLLGEQELQHTNSNHVIIRTQGLFGLGGPNFVQTMYNLAHRNKVTNVITDQVGRVTYAPDLVAATVAVLQKPNVRGVLHFANTEVLSKYDIAYTVFHHLGVEDKLKACTTEDYFTRASRPAYSPLEVVEFGRTVLGYSSPPVGGSLRIKEYIEELKVKESNT